MPATHPNASRQPSSTSSTAPPSITVAIAGWVTDTCRFTSFLRSAGSRRDHELRNSASIARSGERLSCPSKGPATVSSVLMV